MSRRQSKYTVVDATDPQGAAQCDRCSRWWNANQLTWQYAWGGVQLYNIRVLVCPLCYDIPNEQLRTIILPPDPLPLKNPRVPYFAYNEQTVLLAESGAPSSVNRLPPWGAGPEIILCYQDGETPLVLEYLTQTGSLSAPGPTGEFDLEGSALDGPDVLG